jgi:DNA helicase-2/ATP-dependent DNA helicase PcrA
MGDELLADLTDEQLDAVTTRASPLCIIAGAGSGKTRVLTRRIAWHSDQGHIDPRRALAVTFTRKAAGELRSRLRALGQRDAIAAGTFHAIALAILRRHWGERGQTPRRILDNRMGFLQEQFSTLDRVHSVDLATEISWARARLITPERYATSAGEAKRRPRLGGSRTADLYADYEEAKRRRRLIDFDDVLALCHRTLTGDPDFGTAQRWRHRHLFVDEFQDVNPLQFAVLHALIGDDSTLSLVGDPDQAIYGWNGSDPDFILDVTHHLPGCAVLHMRTNFRSSPQILAVAGRLLDREPQPAVRASGPVPTVTAIDGGDEATTLARAVRACHQPGSVWRRQAVLARTNAQLMPVRKSLERHGIPVATTFGADLLRQPEVVELLGEWTPGAALTTVVADTLIDDLELDAAREASVRALLDLADDHLALDAEATLGSFVTTLRSGDRNTGPGEGVTLATFHGAKGLEWPIVHLIGLERGFVPISHARSEAAVAEERRLLHVAVTRAERELHVYWCTSRQVGEGTVDREPSPWLDSMGAADRIVDLVDPRNGVAAARDHLAGTGDRPASGSDDADEDGAELRNALEAWRSRVARGARIDPSSVVPDFVLDALVERQPLDLDELASVAGLAPGHARRWGEELVAIVGAHRRT